MTRSTNGREFYIFVRDHGTSGWRMDDTIWMARQDCIDAMMVIAREHPDATVVAGYSQDGAPIIIPAKITEL